ncbi:MAG: asparaginase [Pseudomonadota bacterium]
MVDKKRIYIAYTGGTIGMKASAQGYIPVPGYLSKSLAKMPEFHRPEMPEFVINEYANLIDSSDVAPADWFNIAKDIQANYLTFDAFIILHGTDTMAFTSSALSFIFGNLQKPVIVTGSQIPLAELRSDGQSNLLNAIYIAANYGIPEVTLFFNNKLYRGNRAKKVDASGFNAFDSPNYPALLSAGIKIQAHIAIAQIPQKVPALMLNDIARQPIGLVSLYPGFDAELLDNVLQRPVIAVLMMAYGVGNAPQSAALKDSLMRAREKKIMVVNCSQCIKGTVDMDGYANGKWMQSLGVISGHDITVEAALTKLHYVLSQSEWTFEHRKKMMETDLRGEITI